ncbi:hypothetical protein SDC9_169494 [bioreactor metagenome]|uniref:Uncharacterized protein n=1 Tax=bioreactor metagenome TaxID=1076179 RepID=A0A645G5G4_9ZZZZ
MPSGVRAAVGLRIAVTMPITSPSIVTSGPPELPGLAAASNWMRLRSTCLPSGDWNSRLKPESTPADTDGPMPNGKPTAITWSPAFSPSVERMVAACRSSGGSLALSTARSFSGWLLITCASELLPSENCTSMRREPCTTCRLVRITPLSTTTTPVPSPRSTSVPRRVRV